MSFQEYQEIEIDAIKPIVTGLIAAAGEHYILNQTNLQNNAIFGATIGTSTLASQLIGNMIPNNAFNLPLLGNGKGLENRILELAFNAGGGYAVNRYVFNNDFAQYLSYQRILIILGADMAGSWVSDALGNKPLQLFN